MIGDRYSQPSRTCSACGFVTDAVAAANDRTGAREPREGDLGVCMACGTMTTLHGREWKISTEAELGALSPEYRREIAEMQLAVEELRRTGFNPGRGGGHA